MINIVSNVMGFSITFPILVTVVVYVFSIKQLRSKWKAVHTAVNYTTLFYILSVITVLYNLTNQMFVAHVLIFLIFLLGISVVFQWKTKGEIIFKYAWKVFWRFTFLLFLSLHICVMVIGLVITVLQV